SVDWIVRGDKKGDYFPTVLLTSTLQPVDEPVSVSFKAKNPIKVFGADAIKMTFDVPPSAVAPFPIKCPLVLPNPDPGCWSIDKWLPGSANPGELERSAVPFIVRIGLQNLTDFPIYKASVNLNDMDPAQLGV